MKCTFKRNNQVTTLGKMKNIVKVNKQSVNIDPSKLFSRLLVISEREGDVKRHFEYELTPVPTSLFIETSMRKANKAQLILYLLGKEFQVVNDDEIQYTEMNVIDGGVLLRQMVWTVKTTFGSIVDSYSRFVRSK